MRFSLTSCFPALLFCLCSCSSHLVPSDAMYASPQAAGASRTNESASRNARVLLKSGNMRLETENVTASSQQVVNLMKQHRGRVITINNDEGEDSSSNLELAVPSAQLETVMEQISQLGKVTSRHIHTRDVTDQWIDLQAKLSNTRALRNRLRDLLQESKSVEDTLKVEKELARVQAELDSLEGKMKTMASHKTYSKLSVSIDKRSIPGPVGLAFKGTWWGVKKLFVIH